LLIGISGPRPFSLTLLIPPLPHVAHLSSI
jgi:hypothetical protein